MWFNMDLFVYLLAILVIGVTRVNITKEVSDDVGITSESTTALNTEMSQHNSLPLAQNLALEKEPNAFHYILLDLGLERSLC